MSSRPAIPDPTQFDSKSDYYDAASKPDAGGCSAQDGQGDRKLPRPVTLPELRADPVLSDMVLLRRGSRLSVQPVTAAEWGRSVALGERK